MPAVNGAGGGKVECQVRRAFGARCNDFHRAESGTEVRVVGVGARGKKDRSRETGRRGRLGARLRAGHALRFESRHKCAPLPVHSPDLCTPPVNPTPPLHLHPCTPYLCTAPSPCTRPPGHSPDLCASPHLCALSHLCTPTCAAFPTCAPPTYAPGVAR